MILSVKLEYYSYKTTLSNVLFLLRYIPNIMYAQTYLATGNVLPASQ